MLIGYVMLGLALVALLVGSSKQKAGVAWGMPVLIVGVVFMLGGIVQVGRTLMGGSSSGSSNVEMQYLRVSTEKLGKYVAEKFPNSKILIIHEPSSTSGQERRDALINGLKEGLGAAGTVVATDEPEIPASLKANMGSGGPGQEGEMMAPMEMWYTAKAFDALVEKHKDCDMVVTLIGLPPQEAARLKFWKMKPRPKLVIAGGSIYEYKAAFAQQLINAAVAYNPAAVYDSNKPPSDLDEAFNKRYVLVTPETVAQDASKYAGLFAN